MASEAEKVRVLRERMVAADIAARGVSDPRVLQAMREVPRERFVPSASLQAAYADCALPIEEGQTISQPYVVAAMSEAAEIAPGDRVLEVGTGSGYGAAVLGRLAAEVWTVERIALLVDRARAVLAELGCANVHVVCADGTLGWPTAAPFDAIVVTAAGPSVPEALVGQLTDGGRLVMPVGSLGGQEMVRVRRSGGGTTEEELGLVQFVPLIGRQGWDEQALDGDWRDGGLLEG